MAIAIQQVENKQVQASSAQAKAQDEQLQSTRKELQTTRSQLIQSDKLSSLGTNDLDLRLSLRWQLRFSALKRNCFVTLLLVVQTSRRRSISTVNALLHTGFAIHQLFPPTNLLLSSKTDVG